MPRILALDYGRRRTGIAVSDPLGMIANPLTTVQTHTLMLFLKDYLGNNSVSTIVLGKPMRMSGEMSAIWVDIEALSRRIQKVFPDVNIVFEDERFTSKLASYAISQSTLPRSKKQSKELIDKTSATIILQSYLG